MLVGGGVFWGGGLRAAALLFLFVVSSSLLSARHPDHPGFARDGRQVFANGGWAAVGAALGTFTALVLPPDALRVVFALFFMFMGLRILRRSGAARH